MLIPYEIHKILLFTTLDNKLSAVILNMSSRNVVGHKCS